MTMARRIWLWIWAVFYRYVLRLIMEKDEERKPVVSLGRLAFAAVLIQFFILWHRALFSGMTVECPPGLLEVFYALAAYVLGTKIVRAGAEALGARRKPALLPPKPEEPQP